LYPKHLTEERNVRAMKGVQKLGYPFPLQKVDTKERMNSQTKRVLKRGRQ